MIKKTKYLCILCLLFSLLMFPIYGYTDEQLENNSTEVNEYEAMNTNDGDNIVLNVDKTIINVGQDTEVTFTATKDGQIVANEEITIDGFTTGTTDGNGQFTTILHPYSHQLIDIEISDTTYYGMIFALEEDEGAVELTGNDAEGKFLDGIVGDVYSEEMAWGLEGYYDTYKHKAIAKAGSNKITFARRSYGDEEAYYMIGDIEVVAGTLNTKHFDGSNTIKIDLSIKYESFPIKYPQVNLEGKNFDNGTQNPEFTDYYNTYIGAGSFDGLKTIRLTPGLYGIYIGCEMDGKNYELIEDDLNLYSNENIELNFSNENEGIYEELLLDIDKNIIKVEQNTEVTLTATRNGQAVANEEITIDGFTSGTTDENGQFTTILHPHSHQIIDVEISNNTFYGKIFALEDDEGAVELTGIDLEGNFLDEIVGDVYSEEMAWGLDGIYGAYRTKAIAKAGSNKITFARRSYGYEEAYYMIGDIEVVAGTLNTKYFDVNNTIKIDLNLKYDNLPINYTDITLEGKNFDNGTQNPEFTGYYNTHMGRASSDGVMTIRLTPGIYDVFVEGEKEDKSFHITENDLSLYEDNIIDLNYLSENLGIINIDYIINSNYDIDKFIELTTEDIDFDSLSQLELKPGLYEIDQLGVTSDEWDVEYYYSKNDNDILDVKANETITLNPNLNIDYANINSETNIESGNSLYFDFIVMTESGYQLQDIEYDDDDNEDMYNIIEITLLNSDGQIIKSGDSYYDEGVIYIGNNMEPGTYTLTVSRDLGPLYGEVSDTIEIEIINNAYEKPILQNITEHYGVIQGIAKGANELTIESMDGTLLKTPEIFSTSKYINRAELSKIISNAINIDSYDSEELNYTDIDENHWAADSIKSVSIEGIMYGYKDGSFGPEVYITREDIAIIIYRAFNIPTYIAEAPMYPDLPDYAREAVESLANAEILSGYPDGTYRPDDLVQIDEAITIVIRAMGIEVQDGYWPTNYINTAYENGLFDGITNTFSSYISGVDQIKVKAINEKGTSTELIVDITYKDGDFNKDGEINLLDLNVIRNYYGAVVGNISYNQDYDLNNDGIINIYDLVILARNIGK